MDCPKCSGESKQVYRVPVACQGGSSIPVACYFCYLKLTGAKPPRPALLPGSEDGSR